MNIVIAPDSFKGSLSALDAGTAMKEGVLTEIPNANISVIPMADGGEGTLETLVYATKGKRIQVEATGPLGERIETEYGILGDGKTVVIETANIAGLPMVAVKDRNPMDTTTFGLGEVILKAIEDGFQSFIIGLGGSATNDGGVGMLQALGATFLDENGTTLKPIGSSLAKVKTVDFTTLNSRLKDCHFKIASDVDNPLCGPRGASYVFAPQKGATEKQVDELDRALLNYATIIEQTEQKQLQNVTGAGAAGGLGFAFLLLGGEIISGSEIVANATKLTEKIEEADWVFTGEGQSDYQTLYGKAPSYIAKIAKKSKKRSILISGSLGVGYEQLYEYFLSCHSITTGPMTLDECMQNAKQLLFHKTRDVSRLLKEMD